MSKLRFRSSVQGLQAEQGLSGAWPSANGMKPGSRHSSGQSAQEGSRLELHRDGAVRESSFESKSHRTVRSEADALLGEGRAQYVAQQRFLCA